MVDLYQMRKLMDRLPMAQFNLDKAMARATKVTSTITGMPHGGGDGDRLADNVALITVARERRDAIRDALKAMRKELEPLIDSMEDPLQQSALRLRYIDGKSVREIAYVLSYSEQHIFRVLQQGERNVNTMQR